MLNDRWTMGLELDDGTRLVPSYQHFEVPADFVLDRIITGRKGVFLVADDREWIHLMDEGEYYRRLANLHEMNYELAVRHIADLEMKDAA